MPIQNIWDRDFLVRINSGRVCAEDVIQSLFSISGDKRFDDLRYYLATWDQVLDFAIDVEDIPKIRTIISALEKSNPNVKVAICGYYNEEMQEMAQYFEALCMDSNWKVAVFEQQERALEWLFEDDAERLSELSIVC